MNIPASPVRFGVLVNGRVAQVKAATIHAVLALDEAHGHLVNARVVAVALPSERWYRLLDQCASKALISQFAPGGSVAEVGERADQFARELFIAAAAFFAAEANDLEDRISLLDGDHRQEICEKLDDIAHDVGETAEVLIGQLEDGTWQQFNGNTPSESRPCRPDETRQPTWRRHRQALSKMVLPLAVGSLGVVITVLADNFRRNAPLTMVVMVSAVLLICLGLLLGGSWSNQVLQAKLRRQAKERRKLNEDWQAIHIASQQNRCPCCTRRLLEQDSYLALAAIKEIPYDDDWQEYVK